MSRSPRRAIALSAVLMVVASLFQATQLTAQPFSTLVLAAGVASDFDIGRLADYWESEPAAFARVATPFHLGSAALTVQRTLYRTKSTAQPDFRILALAVEWNAEVDLQRFLTAFGGIQAGTAAMRFDDSDDIVGNENEGEFLAGLQAGVAIPVARRIGLTFIGAHRRVFTRIPMRLTSVSAGVQITFRTPVRLRTILE